jgi:hypothetical protein
MIKNLSFIFIISGALLMTSCKVTFTEPLRTQIESNGLDLKKVQYYNSKTIVLKRVMATNEPKVTSGQVRMENGMMIEEIQIKKNTPGVIDSIGPGKVRIRFEQGAGRTLLFEPNIYGQYEMKADKWDSKSTGTQTGAGYAEFFQTYQGEVTYEGKKYYYNTSIGKPVLMIKKKESSKISKNTRKATGIKVQ